MAYVLRKLLEYFSVLLIVALILIVVMGVSARVLHISLPWYDELASVILVWLTYIGAAYVASVRAHMSFDGVLLKLHGITQKIVFAVSEITVIGFFAITAYYGYLVLAIFADETMISLPAVPLSLTQAIIPIASVLFILARLCAIPATWHSITQGKNPPHTGTQKSQKSQEP